MTWEEVPAIDRNGIIINYELELEPLLQFTDGLMSASINTTNLSINITGLVEYAEYNISVRAYTSVGPGPYSDPVTERTLEDGNFSCPKVYYRSHYNCIINPTEPATPPQNVSATAISSTKIMVIWREVPAIDQNGIIANYEVQFEPLQFTEILMTSTVNTTDLFIVIDSLEECIDYNINVRAYTSVGPGPYSDPVTERTLEDGNFSCPKLYYRSHYNCIINPTEPATPPQNVSATAISSTKITVIWREVPAIDQNGIITNYEVQFEPLQFTETLMTSTVNTTDLSIVIDSLEEYIEYSISVRAYTSVGSGPYSDPVIERTLEDGRITITLCIKSVYDYLLYSQNLQHLPEMSKRPLYLLLTLW